MLEPLIDSPALLAGVLAAVSVLSYLTSQWAVSAFRHQHVVEYDAWLPPGIIGKARSETAQLLLSQVMAVAVIVLTFFMDRTSREFIGGGFLVVTVATIASNVSDLLIVRSIQRPGAADGRLRYSASHRYRAGARCIGSSIVAGCVAVLFNSKAFLAGAALILAQSVGWYRRARQARGKTEAVPAI
jgi:hypothetical protein